MFKNRKNVIYKTPIHVGIYIYQYVLTKLIGSQTNFNEKKSLTAIIGILYSLEKSNNNKLQRNNSSPNEHRFIIVCYGHCFYCFYNVFFGSSHSSNQNIEWVAL